MREDLRPRLDHVHRLAVLPHHALNVLRLPAVRHLDGQADLRQLRQQPQPVAVVLDERVAGVVLKGRGASAGKRDITPSIARPASPSPVCCKLHT